MKLTFFSSFLVLGPTSSDFSVARPRFSRSTVYFLSHSPILNPISGDFLMARHSFQPRNSLFPCFSLYFPTLRALLREISPIIFLRTPLFALREGFSIRASLILHVLLHLPISFDFLSALHSPLPLRALPHFRSHSSPLFPLSPQEPRTRPPSRITRVRVRSHTPTRQEVFVFFLHRFTHPSQSTVHQRVKGEGKQEKAFTKIHNHLKINTLPQIPDFIHHEFHISAR